MILQPPFHNDKVLSNVVANQEIHPIWRRCSELASRAHKQNIVPIDAALHKQTLTKNNYLQ
jgi:hypothetical protein